MVTIDFDSLLLATQETKQVDFKESFDVNSKGDWCELIKDFAAMANSGGGVVVIGLNNSGECSGFDVKEILQTDPADITNKVFSYTGQHFSGFRLLSIERNGNILAGICIQAVSIPLVFTKPGSYQEGDRQKTAFSGNSVYFRHGAKSEPCTSDDLRQFLEREIERVKTSWLDGIRKVVEAPEGSKVLVVPQDSTTFPLSSVKVVDDPTAPAVRLKEEEILENYPLSFKELMVELRTRYEDFMDDNRFKQIKVELRENSTFAFKRLNNPKKPNGAVTYFYSHSVLDEFDKHYKRISVTVEKSSVSTDDTSP